MCTKKLAMNARTHTRTHALTLLLPNYLYSETSLKVYFYSKTIQLKAHFFSRSQFFPMEFNNNFGPKEPCVYQVR